MPHHHYQVIPLSQVFFRTEGQGYPPLRILNLHGFGYEGSMRVKF